MRDLSGFVYDGTSSHFEYKLVGEVSNLAIFKVWQRCISVPLPASALALFFSPRG